MITKEKLDIYLKYKGDGDAFVRAGKTDEKSLVDNDDWVFLDDIVQDIYLLKNDLVSENMRNMIESKIRNNVDNNETESILYNINL